MIAEEGLWSCTCLLDYLLSLGEEEGISDLFDAYDLEKLPLVEDFMCS